MCFYLFQNSSHVQFLSTTSIHIFHHRNWRLVLAHSIQHLEHSKNFFLNKIMSRTQSNFLWPHSGACGFIINKDRKIRELQVLFFSGFVWGNTIPFIMLCTLPQPYSYQSTLFVYLTPWLFYLLFCIFYNTYNLEKQSK